MYWSYLAAKYRLCGSCDGSASGFFPGSKNGLSLPLEQNGALFQLPIPFIPLKSKTVNASHSDPDKYLPNTVTKGSV